MKIAISGHRPSKLGGYDSSNAVRTSLRSRLKDALIAALRGQCSFQNAEVYTGGALGFDTDAARVCAEIGIPFVVCIPFPSFYKHWSKPDQETYYVMLTYALRVEHVCTNDPPIDSRFAAINLLMARNRYMVDRTQLLIAAWDGSSGGTQNCVKYASGRGRTVIVLPPQGQQYKIN